MLRRLAVAVTLVSLLAGCDIKKSETSKSPVVETIEREISVTGEGRVNMTSESNGYFFAGELDGKITTFYIGGDYQSARADAIIKPGDRVKLRLKKDFDYNTSLGYRDILEVNDRPVAH